MHNLLSKHNSLQQLFGRVNQAYWNMYGMGSAVTGQLQMITIINLAWVVGVYTDRLPSNNVQLKGVHKIEPTIQPPHWIDVFVAVFAVSWVEHSLAHTRQALSHWATFPALEWVLKMAQLQTFWIRFHFLIPGRKTNMTTHCLLLEISNVWKNMRPKQQSFPQ
jgi:hypothetical protein